MGTRMALGLAYDGQGWHGWQTQPDGHTVQDALQAALARFLAVPRVATVCAGRTDSGVHALQQVVHLDTEVVRRPWAWVRGLNALLPASVRVLWAQPVGADFHARFDARARTYVYLLQRAPVRAPLWRGRAGWVHDESLDVAAMRAAAAHWLGTHDFSAFRSAECQARTPVRTLQALEIHAQGDWLLFEFRANGFLQHMVRNLMGNLLAIGRHRAPVDWAATLLASRDRRRGAPTFMADGLYLAHVAYPQQPELPLLSARDALAAQLACHWIK